MENISRRGVKPTLAKLRGPARQGMARHGPSGLGSAGRGPAWLGRELDNRIEQEAILCEISKARVER